MDTSLFPAVIGYLVFAGVATALAIGTLVVLARDALRRPERTVVSISAAHPGAAAVTRHAA